MTRILTMLGVAALVAAGCGGSNSNSGSGGNGSGDGGGGTGGDLSAAANSDAGMSLPPDMQPAYGATRSAGCLDSCTDQASCGLCIQSATSHARMLYQKVSRCVRGECFPHPDGGAAPCMQGGGTPSAECTPVSGRQHQDERQLRRRHDVLRHLLQRLFQLRGRPSVGVAPAVGRVSPLARSGGGFSPRPARAQPRRQAADHEREHDAGGDVRDPMVAQVHGRDVERQLERQHQPEERALVSREDAVTEAPRVHQRRKGRVRAMQRRERRAHQKRAVGIPARLQRGVEAEERRQHPSGSAPSRSGAK